MFNLDPGFPCWRCNVRADVDCKHRPGTPVRVATGRELLESGRTALGTGARWYEKRSAA